MKRCGRRWVRRVVTRWLRLRAEPCRQPPPPSRPPSVTPAYTCASRERSRAAPARRSAVAALPRRTQGDERSRAACCPTSSAAIAVQPSSVTGLVDSTERIAPELRRTARRGQHKRIGVNESEVARCLPRTMGEQFPLERRERCRGSYAEPQLSHARVMSSRVASRCPRLPLPVLLDSGRGRVR